MSNLPRPPPYLTPPPLPASTANSGEGSLTELLLSTTSAANTRTQEAILLFQNIACVIDSAITENECLPQHLKITFYNFVADLNPVARRHFDCHVRGSPRPPIPYSSSGLPQTHKPPTAVQSSAPRSQVTPPIMQQATIPEIAKRPVSFAKVVSTPAPWQYAQKPKRSINFDNTKSRAKPREVPEDNRLFVRVSAGHPALHMSPYAVMLQINNHLKEKLVREVQSIKTGFTICPVSKTAQETLFVRMGEIETFLSYQGQCKVEKPTSHIAYRISGVPRSYQGFDGTSMTSTEITSELVSDALIHLTNVAPLNVLESRSQYDSKYSPSKSWVVLYPKGPTLSKVLPLFGVRVPVKILPQRLRTPQCGRCFGWHNERACARLPRCRLCASTQHLESGHTSCDPTKKHLCPPKCANCHGPHPADSLECLIRPRKDNTLPGKAQMSEIRQAAAAARLRLKAAHCGVMGGQATDNATENATENSNPIQVPLTQPDS